MHFGADTDGTTADCQRRSLEPSAPNEEAI